MMVTKTRIKKTGVKGEPRKLSARQVNKCYAIIKSILNRYDVPSYYYSLGRSADNSVCIEYNGREWIVYEVSRGYKIHLRSFRSAYEAGSSLFRSVVIGKEKIQGMEFYLKKGLDRLFSSKIISSRYPKAFVTTDSKGVVSPAKVRHLHSSNPVVDNAEIRIVDDVTGKSKFHRAAAVKTYTTSLRGKIVKPSKVGEGIKKNKDSNKKD